MSIETRAFTLSVKAAGDDGTLSGYGSVFDVRDSYDDAIARGAFRASLEKHTAAGTMPALLWQHDAAQPIGVWTSVTEDDAGLRMDGKLAIDTARGKEAYSLLKMGALNGLSIGFMPKAWDFDKKTQLRTLTEVELYEVSLVTFPANEGARVTSVRSANEIKTLKDAERLLRDAGFSRSDATTFVSRVLAMGKERRDAVKTTEQAHQAAFRLLKTIQS